MKKILLPKWTSKLFLSQIFTWNLIAEIPSSGLAMQKEVSRWKVNRKIKSRPETKKFLQANFAFLKLFFLFDASASEKFYLEEKIPLQLKTFCAKFSHKRKMFISIYCQKIFLKLIIMIVNKVRKVYSWGVGMAK